MKGTQKESQLAVKQVALRDAQTSFAAARERCDGAATAAVRAIAHLHTLGGGRPAPTEQRLDPEEVLEELRGLDPATRDGVIARWGSEQLGAAGARGVAGEALRALDQQVRSAVSAVQTAVRLLEPLQRGAKAAQQRVDEYQQECLRIDRRAHDLAVDLVQRARRLAEQHEQLAEEWHRLKARAAQLGAEDEHVRALKATIEDLVGMETADRLCSRRRRETAPPRASGTEADYRATRVVTDAESRRP